MAISIPTSTPNPSVRPRTRTDLAARATLGSSNNNDSNKWLKLRHCKKLPAKLFAKTNRKKLLELEGREGLDSFSCKIILKPLRADQPPLPPARRPLVAAVRRPQTDSPTGSERNSITRAEAKSVKPSAGGDRNKWPSAGSERCDCCSHLRAVAAAHRLIETPRRSATCCRRPIGRAPSSGRVQQVAGRAGHRHLPRADDSSAGRLARSGAQIPPSD